MLCFWVVLVKGNSRWISWQVSYDEGSSRMRGEFNNTGFRTQTQISPAGMKPTTYSYWKNTTTDTRHKLGRKKRGWCSWNQKILIECLCLWLCCPCVQADFYSIQGFNLKQFYIHNHIMCTIHVNLCNINAKLSVNIRDEGLGFLQSRGDFSLVMLFLCSRLLSDPEESGICCRAEWLNN